VIKCRYFMAVIKKVDIYKQFSFDAAHRLPHVSIGHKCQRLHGHTYHLTVYVSGEVDPQQGWVMDFGDIKQQVKPIIDQLDHYYLNEIKGLENPTAENIACWIWERLKPTLPLLSQIEIKETCTAGCVYRGESCVR